MHYAVLGDSADLDPLERRPQARRRGDQGRDPTATELKALRDCFVGDIVPVDSEGGYVGVLRAGRRPGRAYRLLEKLAQARLIIIDEKPGQKTSKSRMKRSSQVAAATRLAG